MLKLDRNLKFTEEKVQTGNVLLDATTIVFSNELINGETFFSNNVLDLSTFLESLIFNEEILTLKPDFGPILRFEKAVKNFEEMGIDKFDVKIMDNSQRNNEVNQAVRFAYKNHISNIGVIKFDEYSNLFVPDEYYNLPLKLLSHLLKRKKEPREKLWEHLKKIDDFQSDTRALFGSLFNQLQWGDTLFDYERDEDGSIIDTHEINFRTDKITALIWFRSQVYYHLSNKYNTPYRPDTFRTPIFENELEKYDKTIADIINGTFKKIDQIENEYREEFNRRRNVSTLEVNMPSLLSLVLERCSKRSDIVDEALNLRRDSKIRNFRTFCANLESLYYGGASKTEQIERQERRLENEIEKINREFGNPEEDTSRIKFFMKCGFDLIRLKLLPERFIEFLSKYSIEMPDILLDYLSRRQLFFLHDYVKRARHIAGLNPQLKRVFGKELTKGQIEMLRDFRLIKGH